MLLCPPSTCPISPRHTFLSPYQFCLDVPIHDELLVSHVMSYMHVSCSYRAHAHVGLMPCHANVTLMIVFMLCSCDCLCSCSCTLMPCHAHAPIIPASSSPPVPNTYTCSVPLLSTLHWLSVSSPSLRSSLRSGIVGESSGCAASMSRTPAAPWHVTADVCCSMRVDCMLHAYIPS